MLGSGGNENREKNTIGLELAESNFARATHFFSTFYAIVLHDYSVKLPETS